MNRLTSIGDSGYGRNFVYDAYGNMAVQSFSGIGLSSLTPYSGSGNHPFDGSNRLLNAGYDLVGNQTRAGSLQIGYDAENRQRLLRAFLRRRTDAVTNFKNYFHPFL